jgi:hypothetical protein
MKIQTIISNNHVPAPEERNVYRNEGTWQARAPAERNVLSDVRIGNISLFRSYGKLYGVRSL